MSFSSEDTSPFFQGARVCPWQSELASCARLLAGLPCRSAWGMSRLALAQSWEAELPHG